MLIVLFAIETKVAKTELFSSLFCAFNLCFLLNNLFQTILFNREVHDDNPVEKLLPQWKTDAWKMSEKIQFLMLNCVASFYAR